MARSGITFSQVEQAADTLLGEAKQPTIRSVRDLLDYPHGSGYASSWRHPKRCAIHYSPCQREHHQPLHLIHSISQSQSS